MGKVAEREADGLVGKVSSSACYPHAAMRSDWKTRQFFRMWPRALFHMKQGKAVLEDSLKEPGVYVLYRDDVPYYIGKTGPRNRGKRLVGPLSLNARAGPSITAIIKNEDQTGLATEP